MNENGSEMTLDPPGRIAVIGAGPLGLEAALYGRFLGYDVIVFERGDIGQSLRDHHDQPLPMLPSACLSSLAWSAISAQLGSGDTLPAAALPLTIGQWLADGLEPLAKTDLLRGRIHTRCEVTGIELVEVTAEDDGMDEASAENNGDGSVEDSMAFDDMEDEIDGDVPADFRLSVRSLADASPSGRGDARDGERAAAVEFEAVVLAIGDADPRSIAGIDHCQESPYFFRLGDRAADAAGGSQPSADQALRTGWREIVRIFAQLGGRSELDLYRPLRL